MFGYLFAAFVSIPFLIIVGFCLLYIFQSIVLYTIGRKENSAFKKKSAVRTFFTAVITLIIMFFLWWVAITWSLSGDDFSIG